MTLEEEVNHPKHYTSHESGIQAIEITRYLIGDLSNAWKYAMRYEDKKTPKKDLQKLCWYLNDFRENFIDENNVCTGNVFLTNEILCRMMDVINAEPVEAIRNCFKLIYHITTDGGLVNPEEFDKVIADVTSLSETFS